MTMDLNERIFYYFNELTKIPHGSRNEKQLSDWLVQFAKDHGLRWIQDEMNNVIIYKAGTAGLEKAGAVILQAHMDMVCEKEADVDFDFETQALNTYVEDGWLKARGTTLGADDGVGVAMMLALLEDKPETASAAGMRVHSDGRDRLEWRARVKERLFYGETDDQHGLWRRR